ncbi:hypothetical protein K450DRAFT_248840 [Umbelopsis ramanniana AG]|uniref:MI domain-containing protein n=1 Tax=Umbelopsis ramanniana AG TaxID=1314678 RepID=A0AAD5E705_UMBRA|nr:uncharacterized protein K450DRAFT_248840 [Umbelopsis ramanniana AG]KAI8578062.1 hypothetical protein K450DRAFT_248840 [Umbelopsis ramanniana AG]
MKQQQQRGGNMRGRGGRGRGRGGGRGGRGGRKFDGNGQRIKTSTTNLPLELKAQVEADEKDTRKFSEHFENKVKARKDLRKQKRADKKIKKMPVPKAMRPDHSFTAPKQANSQVNKKAVNGNGSNLKRPIEEQKEETKKPSKKRKEGESNSLKKLSASNPLFYSLIESDNLISSYPGGTDTSDTAVQEDDLAIAMYEKKLGLDKKKKKSKEGVVKLGSAFEEDGLMDILDGLDEPQYEAPRKGAGISVSKKATKAENEDSDDGSEDEDENSEDYSDDEDGDVNGYLDDLENGFNSEDESDDDEDDEDVDLLDDDDEDLEDSDVNDESDEHDKFDSDDEFLEMPDGEEPSDSNEEGESDAAEITSIDGRSEIPKNTQSEQETGAKAQTATAGKYVPPHLRGTATTKSEQQIRLQRALQGLLNKLSESNLESILMEIEKCYSNYPRHDVTSTLTELILISISQKANLLDSFVILYAVVVGSLYRLIGVDFAAHFVQTLIESFEKNHKTLKDAAKDPNAAEDDSGLPGSKEAKNLLTLVLELYNFQVISCILMYDLINVLIDDMDEINIELLLKIMRTSGAQLRADDPTSLKDIINAIQSATEKRDTKTMSSRYKFMLETIANIKNNKIKQQHGNVVDKEMVLKMKKFLSSLAKKRSLHSTEALRVSLEDIHNIDTKGKWWLVGSSWKDNLVGTESKYASKEVADDLKKDASLQEALMKLARKQGMNTDIRRSIFIVLMSSEDYVDAYERLMKLTLTEVQQREIARVLLQCSGNEKHYNPYYALVANRLCGHDHSFKVTLQYCLWDFLRECGEPDVGGLERSRNVEASPSETEKISLRRIVNTAKFYAFLVSENALTLSILKSINFSTVGQSARLFLQLFLSNLIINSQSQGGADRRDAQSLVSIYLKVVQLPAVSQGILFFLHHFVRKADLGQTEDEQETVRWGCGILKEVGQRARRSHEELF